MYDEKKLKFWAICQIIKKWFLILLFSIAGTAIGFVISEFVVDVLNEIAMYRIAFIAGLTLLGFVIGLLLTSNINSNIQDAYWKIEVMKKLDIISHKLENSKCNELITVDQKKVTPTVESPSETPKETDNEKKEQKRTLITFALIKTF